MKKQRGVTMIELMIAMMLGLGLVAGIGQLFVQSQKSFRLQRNASDMTDDAAFILESFAKGVLLAGFTDKPDPSSFREDLNVSSVSGVADMSLSAGEFIHGADTQLVYRYELGTSPFTNNGNCTTAVRTSCELDNFIGTSGLIGNKEDMVTVRIYKKNDSNGIPVFYSKTKIRSFVNETDDIQDAEPLISEVEKLEFRYGVKTDTGLYYYTKAANVTDWTKVFAVKVFLVMRSAEDNLVREQKGYEIDNIPANPAPSDKRLYKVFSKTVFLRATDK
jgi:type IV pilus assembly protein PilW